MGWAVSAHNTDKNGFTTIVSHVHFDFVPLDDMLPMILSGFWNSMVQTDQKDFSMDAESELKIDTHGQLYKLSLIISTPSIPTPIRISGNVSEKKLRLRIRMGDYQESVQYDYAGDAILGNDLMPQTRMPNLYLGQEWTVPVYSPFRTKSGTSVEMFQAKVESRDSISWSGSETPTWQVVLRRESGALFGNSRAARTKLWVDMNGEVLKQECFMFGSRLAFVRTQEGKSQEYWASSQNLRRQRVFYERMNENNFADEHDKPLDLGRIQALLAAKDFSFEDITESVPWKNIFIRTMKYNSEPQQSVALKPDIWTEVEQSARKAAEAEKAAKKSIARKPRPRKPAPAKKPENSRPILK
jgi:hypothetical protein